MRLDRRRHSLLTLPLAGCSTAPAPSASAPAPFTAGVFACGVDLFGMTR